MSDATGAGKSYRLLYTSRASRIDGNDLPAMVAQIVECSEARNRERGVTGMLICHDGWFIQALEGPHDTLLELYQRITGDPRHEDVRLVSLEPISKRAFRDWGMRAGRPSTGLDRTTALTTLSALELLELLKASPLMTAGGEEGRLDALASLAILDTLPEQQFDDIALVAKSLAGATFAAISLVDRDRQWFKAQIGLDASETARDQAFCAYAILESELLWVEDALLDERFSQKDAVLNAPHIRFYAGAPLQVAGHNVGTLCVMDVEPKRFTPTIALALSALGRTVSARLEARRDERIAASLLASATDAIICSDSQGSITFWNASAERLFGYTAAEVRGQRLELIVPDSFKRAHTEGFERLKRTGSTRIVGRSVELPARRKDGSEFPMELALAVWGEKETMGAGAIIRDISERQEAIRALGNARDAAETANVAKSAFLANMSHEIRTPLNGVIAVTDLLVASGLNPSQTEMAKLILSSGEQLQSLLGDILDIARIESGEMALVEQPFWLGDLLRSTVDLCGLKAREKNLRLALELGAGVDRRFTGDPTRLKQVFTNLISNAVKFTDVGSVSLTVEEASPSSYAFVVTDTGVGFDAEAKAHIFGRFQQADGSITRRFGGSGLGLAICKQLVALMGGEIGCESTPGVGSTFRVLLPLQALTDHAPSNEVLSLDASAPEQRVTVLLADDHPTNRRVVELILGTLDTDIVSVENGAQALEMYVSRPFDVVLMDMMMPVMDGLAATRAIRAYEEKTVRGRVPILMLTANALPEHVSQAMEAGADRHVSKPITAASLIAALSEVLTPALEQVVSHVA